MEDYYTQFSCLFDVGTAENAIAALAIRDQFADRLDEDEGTSIGFDVRHDRDEAAGAL